MVLGGFLVLAGEFRISFNGNTGQGPPRYVAINQPGWNTGKEKRSFLYARAQAWEPSWGAH